MSKVNEPRSFTVVSKGYNNIQDKRNLDIVLCKLFMDYIKANPDFIKNNKE